VEQPLYRAV